MNATNARNNKGWLVGVIASLVVIVAIGAVVIGSFASAKNYGAKTEANLRAAQADSRNVFAQAGQKIREVVQVPQMYTDDFNRVTETAIKARVGENGSQATVQWFKEQNPQLDSSVYTKIQQIIEASRKDFENAQRRQIDVRRQYEGAIGSFWRGFWLGVAGYPKVDLDTFDIVSTAEADRAFETKQEAGPIQLRPKN